MATIEFTATGTDGQTYTRTSGTMAYVAVSIGSQVMWHKTMASAYAAAKGKYQTWSTGVPADVVPAVPTAINGKIDGTEFVDGWGDIPASAFTELVAAKLGKKVVAEKPAKETPAQARARQRAAKKAREAAAQAVPTADSILAGAVEAAKVEEPVVVEAPAKLKKGQMLVDGKLVWRNSGAAHNEYRRARRAALKAAQA